MPRPSLGSKPLTPTERSRRHQEKRLAERAELIALREEVARLSHNLALAKIELDVHRARRKGTKPC